MIEYSIAARVEVPLERNLTDLVADRARQEPQRVVLSRPSGGPGEWSDVTAAKFYDEVVAVAKGFVAAGITPGDRVGLMARTRYEWTLIDFAIWFAGAVTVPIYETSSEEQVQWILSDSDAVAVVVETAVHQAAVESVRLSAVDLRNVWTIDEGGIEALVALGAEVPDEEIARRRATLTGTSLATLIYTSGTTGRPKGVELTHGNFLFLVGNLLADMPEIFAVPDSSTLLFLPLAHVYARMVEVAVIASGIRMGHSPNIKNLLSDLASFHPTFVLAVPRVFEKIYNSSSQKAHSEGKGRIFEMASATAIAYSEALDRGGASLLLRLRHGLFDRLVYGKLRAALGGQVLFALSGGAPLGARLGHFFRGIGLTIIEGYGLTETTAPTSCNPPRMVRVGTVGRPIPGTSIKIADDGEVLVKGGHVFAGYWKNPLATAEAMDQEGWFRTGDVGALDAEGYLTITGRKKEMLVTAGGKNVAPAVLEDRLRAHALVSQCIVVGDGQPFIACLVTLDAEVLPRWLKTNGQPEMGPAEAAENVAVRAEVQKAIDDANKAVSKPESIRKFVLLAGDFTEEGGELTPSLKLKRSVVMKQYAEAVESLYS